MKGADAARRLVQDLRAAAKIRGHGTLTRTLRACGKSDDYLHNVAAERIPLGTFLDLLGQAGLKLEARASRALDDDDPVTRFIADSRRIRAEYRMPPLLDQARRQGAVGKAADDGGFDLEAIDDLRYHDPDVAARQAARAVRAARGPTLVAASLGVWASCQRMRYRLDLATGALGLAVEIAEVAGADQVNLRSLQRACPVLRDRGEPDFAIDLAQRVTSAYLAGGDLEMLPRALVDYSVVLIDAGDSAHAEPIARMALHLLRTNDFRNLAGAWSVISRCLVAARRFDEASSAASTAASWAERTGANHLIGRIHWILGQIDANRNALDRAEKSYREALKALSDIAVDATLIGAELVRVMLRQGRPAQAARLAGELRWFEEPLRADPLDVDRTLVAAVIDLATAGEMARLSVDLVNEVLKRIRSGLDQRSARLRTSLRPDA